jgi:hypothetical protein
MKIGQVRLFKLLTMKDQRMRAGACSIYLLVRSDRLRFSRGRNRGWMNLTPCRVKVASAVPASAMTQGATKNLPFSLILALRAPYGLLSIELAAGSLQQSPASVALLRDTPFGPTEHKLLSRAPTNIPRQVACPARVVTPV